MAKPTREYLDGLKILQEMNLVDNVSKDYLRYKSGLIKKNPDGSPVTDSQYLSSLGKVINPGDPSMFLNETQAAIEDQVVNYQDTRKGSVDDTFKKYKEQLFEDYASQVNGGLAKASKKIKSELEKKLKGVPADKKKEALKYDLENNLYQILGSQVKDLDLSEEYIKKKDANKDLVEAVNGLKELDALEDSERPNAVADQMIEKYQLGDNYKNFRRDWNGMYDQMRSNYIKIIGKQLLKEDGGEYAINRKLLKEAYGNSESVKKMTPVIGAKYK